MNFDSSSNDTETQPLTCLVAGAAGYIGSNVCFLLLQTGYKVIVVDNFDNSNPDVINELKELAKDQSGSLVFPGTIDLLQRGAIDHLLATEKNVSVINLAGLKAVEDSVSDPITYYMTNLNIMMNILDSMNRTGCRRLVFSSSATVYGSDTPIPFDEKGPIGQNLANPYAFTKACIESMLDNLCKFDPSWSITSLRYFNPINSSGNDQIRLADRPKKAAKNLMPAIMKAIQTPDYPLHIYGNDYKSKDGTAERDFIHIADLARAHLLALGRMKKGYNFYNVGSGRGITVLEFVNAVEQSQKTKVNYVIDQRRAGDVAAYYASIEKIRREIGWEPQKTLEDLCKL